MSAEPACCKRCKSTHAIRLVTLHLNHTLIDAFWLCQPCRGELDRFLTGSSIPGTMSEEKPIVSTETENETPA